MMIVSIVIALVVIVLVYWKIPFSTQRNRFLKSMEKRSRETQKAEGLCTREEINTLPKPFRRYCDYVGLEGTQKHNRIRVMFKGTDFIFDDSKGVQLKMDYDLWLFANKWYRTAYCTSSMHGIPFEGQDYITDDKTGGMRGYLGKAVKIFETADKESYVAGLISWLIEGIVFNPSFLFSEYLSFEEIDNNHVKATITYEGVSGSGIFTISDEGEITTFYSDERQVEEINGKRIHIGWRCEAEGYVQKGDILMPQIIKSIKLYPDKEITYFKAQEYEVYI